MHNYEKFRRGAGGNLEVVLPGVMVAGVGSGQGGCSGMDSCTWLSCVRACDMPAMCLVVAQVHPD